MDMRTPKVWKFCGGSSTIHKWLPGILVIIDLSENQAHYAPYFRRSKDHLKAFLSEAIKKFCFQFDFTYIWKFLGY